MSASLTQLQGLLRELFQFELSDLDFGIYRLFRLKQDELKQFIEQQLPAAVDKAFADVAGSDVKHLADEVTRLAQRVCTEVDPAALSDSGVVKDEFRSIKAKAVKELVTEYETKKAALDAVRITEEQKLDTFNHLYNFFSRYYDAGDFIPKRFYGARSHYAVPYNGQETLFHWANQDQHYIKTAEAFRDYAFNVDALGGPFRVRFIITAANVPKDNTKGDRRYFFPLAGEVSYDDNAKTLTLPFHYRLPVEKELKGANGEGNGDDPEAQKQKKIGGDKLQEALLQAALPAVLTKVKEPALKAALAEVLNKQAVEQDKAEPVTLLLKRLRHFARRNTTDYFIHKHLAQFLTQELDFYIKDQILHIGDLEGDFDGKRRMLRALRLVAADLITFLAQIEEVQLRLFEKRKFVLRADYLVTLAHLPKALRKDLLDPKRGAKQLQEWQDLYAFDKCAALLDWKGKLTDAFLDKHPTLVVNTANFDEAFKGKLLESFDDIGAVTDGLLINSENYQALRLVQRWLYERVKCIYTDPPYNTGSDDFIYKDRYKRSSWMAMMLARLELAKSILARDASIFISIDDNEVATLRELLDRVFEPENFIATVIWQKVFAPKNTAKHFSEDHDFILAYARRAADWRPMLLPRSEEANARYENPDKDPRGDWSSSDMTARNYYSEGTYEVTSPTGRKFKPSVGTYWRVSYQKFTALDADKRIWWGEDGNNMPRLKRFLREVKEGVVPQTLWLFEEVGHTQEAKQEMLARVRFARTEDVLNTVKPPRLVQRILQIGTPKQGTCFVADFFAGSGSTIDAVIRQNQADGVARKFLAVEAGNHFDSIIHQRAQRSTAFPEWAECVPTRLPTEEEAGRSPRLVKVLRLETYEDALHNAASPDALKRSDPRAAAHTASVGAESYRLKYLAKLPADESASMLQLERLEHPFSYTLEVLTDAGPQTQVVDLVETFNLLLGLDVQRMQTWENPKDKSNGNPRRYRVVKGADRVGKQYLILWRDMAALDPKVEREFLEDQLARHKESFDYQLINGDHATPGFESLDGRFKQLMTDGQ